jgi:hypothetical protein
VGLVPDELFWLAAPATMAEDVSDDEHNSHHNRAYVRWRNPSPAGIRPTGNEVHAYVSLLESVDVVLFSTRQTGTFVVRCDLHAKDVGRLVVFDAGRPTTLMSAAGNAQSLARDPLSVALSRDLGTMDHPGAPGVFMEAIYAPAEYLTQLAGGPVAMATPLEPDQYVAILLTEGVHTGRLPGRGESPALYIDGDSLPLIDWKVTTELPHHRATLYRFARDDVFGTKEQVMTLRLAPGHKARPARLPEVFENRTTATRRSTVESITVCTPGSLPPWPINCVESSAVGKSRRNHPVERIPSGARRSKSSW